MKAVMVVSVFMIATFTWAAQSVLLSLPPVEKVETCAVGTPLDPTAILFR